MSIQVGIWLDKKQAHTITLIAGAARCSTQESGLDFFHPKGGSRSKTRWGPQEVIKERSYMEREKQQLKGYFERLVQGVDQADEIALYGPGSTPEKFLQHLQQQHPEMATKVVQVTRSTKMTQNQLVALVRNGFAPDSSATPLTS